MKKPSRKLQLSTWATHYVPGSSENNTDRKDQDAICVCTTVIRRDERNYCVSQGYAPPQEKGRKEGDKEGRSASHLYKAARKGHCMEVETECLAGWDGNGI